ncbi:MAG: SUMF1/EgtB/PvdO family nonheme iron enzyme [Lentimicrobiaceae bacterium]|nr:SUMF1/EgtB/PvdO family nonheme iron enzyme [Lentimicrobiaceae bacterium]
MKKIFCLFAGAALLSVAVVSCKPEEPVLVTGVKLSQTTLELTVSWIETISATVVPDDADNKAITWESSDPSVAAIQVEKNTCTITAVKAGTADIIVTTADGGKTATCVVTVLPLQPGETEVVFVEGGTFTMGAIDSVFSWERPLHQVTLSNFKIAKTLVTQAQWKAIMDGNNPSSYKGEDRPVENVSWNQVQTFINRLNEATGREYRLATEAEWEYAARGGKKSQGYIYSGSNNIDAVAWYQDNSGNQTHPIGGKAPNELGIFDMSGNVWEYCNDRYDEYTSEPQTNPTGPTSITKQNRVVRGGSFGAAPNTCRLAYRNSQDPTNPGFAIGFRLVHP